MKNWNKFKVIALLSFTLMASSLFAQSEQLVPLSGNPVLQKYRLDHPAVARLQAANDTIDLPIIDDFSSTKVVPDDAYWVDQEVYVNSTLARNPITIGVATFDGLDANGNAYDNSNSNASGLCDHLTSRPLYLHTRPASLGGGVYSLADSITLSFFYEKKGWGDAPEVTDSLVVEYFNPDLNKWSIQWASTGPVGAGQDTTFSEVRLILRDSSFLKDGFQVRFHTYGSQTGMQDTWHVDYVRFYRAYNSFSGQMDTTLLDLAMSQPNVSLLNGYTSIPWDHFTSLSASSQHALLKSNNTLTYRICDTQREDVGYNERIYDYAGTIVSSTGAPNGNITTQLAYNTFLQYNFPISTSVFPNTPSLTGDSTYFVVKDFFSNGNGFQGPKTNDTVTYKQEFYNYYSYDDGTAEAGYDLISAVNGKLAMRFDIIKPDTLRAIRFAFVQQVANVATKLFTIKVWSSLSPETVIYQEFNNRPVYVDSVNGFATYVLNQIVPVSGTIYVGFQQVAADGLHLGFDRNNTSNSKMFYNINGTWGPVTVAPGSFMIRPVMGDTTLFAGLHEITRNGDVLLSPNPTNSLLNIRVAQNERISHMQIFTIDGRMQYDGTFQPEFNVQSLAPGMYLLKLNDYSGAIIQSRFVVAQ